MWAIAKISEYLKLSINREFYIITANYTRLNEAFNGIYNLITFMNNYILGGVQFSVFVYRVNFKE